MSDTNSSYINLTIEIEMQNLDRLPSPQGFLLTMGNYLGTLSAARDLGKHGIPVILLEHQRHTITSASCYISSFQKVPSPEKIEDFIQWLLDFGERNPGYVLYPTSDDMCWAIATRQKQLKKFFYLFQPSEKSIYKILNKGELFECCQLLGIDCPVTWVSGSELEQKNLAEMIAYPVIVKPKTQAGMIVNLKGILCHSSMELLSAFDTFKNCFPYHQHLLDYDPNLASVMVQKFYPEASKHIYSLAGFFDAKNNIYILRAAEKVLQIPLEIGVGLCFESREIDRKPAEQLRAILEYVGYKGAFEAEFIHLASENRFLLIDINPRFYGQMGFEIARDLPIARLCYFAAIGDEREVQRLGKLASNYDRNVGYKYRALWMLNLLVFTKFISGKMSRVERYFWIEWSKTDNCYDPIYHPDDPNPLWAYIWDRVVNFIKYPRSSFRIYF